MIDAIATTPETPAGVPAGPNRAWRIVALVVTLQVLIVLAGIVLFSAMGLANDGGGSCGGG